MPGPLALAAPYLISAGAPIVASLVGKLFGGKQNAVDPAVKKQLDLANAMTERRGGYLDMLEGGLNRGKLMDQDTGKVLRMFLPGVGGNLDKFNKSMNAFLNAADFGLKNDQATLAQLIAGAQSPGNASAVQAGAQADYGASQKAVGSLATALADIGGDLLAKKTGGSENQALAEAIAGAGAAAPGTGGQPGTGGMFDFGDLLDNIDWGGK